MNDFREYSAAFYARQSDILHFGIPGMKWGVRRFQDKFGRLLSKFRDNKNYGDNRISSKDTILDKNSVTTVGNNAVRTGELAKANKAK